MKIWPTPKTLGDLGDRSLILLVGSIHGSQNSRGFFLEGNRCFLLGGGGEGFWAFCGGGKLWEKKQLTTLVWGKLVGEWVTYLLVFLAGPEVRCYLFWSKFEILQIASPEPCAWIPTTKQLLLDVSTIAALMFFHVFFFSVAKTSPKTPVASTTFVS